MGMVADVLTVRARPLPMRKSRRSTGVSFRPSSRIRKKNGVVRDAGCRVVLC